MYDCDDDDMLFRSLTSATGMDGNVWLVQTSAPLWHIHMVTLSTSLLGSLQFSSLKEAFHATINSPHTTDLKNQ